MNITVTSDSADGASIAPKQPCNARAPSSIPVSTEAPPSAEASAKPMTPTWNVRLRPSRSANRPPNNSKAPNGSAYAVTTHCRSASEKPRSCCAEGSAMFTTVPSSTTMSCAKPTKASAFQRRGSASDEDGGVG